jgi:signal transduction histidine kinase/ActR/RegA family two-component response regulator
MVPVCANTPPAARRIARRWPALPAFALTLLTAAGAAAQTQAGWRYWSPADGIQESHSRRIGSMPGGGVTIRHGLVKSVDFLDGYVVEAVAEPRAGNNPETLMASVDATVAGDAWAISEGVLKQYRGAKWVVRATPTPGDEMRGAIPLAEHRVVVLFPSRVAAFDATTSAWTTLVDSDAAGLGRFTTMVRGFAGEIWIAAGRGIGRLDGTALTRWTAFPAADLEDFSSPLPGHAGELFAAAVDARTRHKVALQLVEGRYQRVFESTKALRAWRGPHGSVWVLEGTRTWRLGGGQREAVARYGPLSGIVYDIVTEPGGVFWIASTTGVGRYAPQLWRTPDAIKGLDQPVHAAVEDARGRLWFAATESLVELDGTAWRVHALPPDTQTVTNQTSSLAVLPDGRLAMTAAEPGGHVVLTFDPRTGRFGHLSHPKGRRLTQVWSGRHDRVLMRTSGPCGLEVWDRHGATVVPVLSAPGTCEKLREVHDAADGSLWFGTTTFGGGVLRPGAAAVEPFGPDDGYPEQAVYGLLAPAADRVLAGGRDALAVRADGRWTIRQRALDAVRSLMQARDGTVWVASGSGVHQLRAGVWLTNGEADGLPADAAFKVLQDSKGRIWAGTGRGLSLYDPTADRDAPRTILAKSNAEEAPPDGDVNIAFSGVDRWKYTLPDRLLFSYRLDGGPWSEFRSGTSAPLRGVARGRHRFEVRAMDRNGNLGPIEAFAFGVPFPWYQHPGFLGIAATSLIVIGCLLGFARVQYRQLARAKLAAETANRCKSEFLAHMSHEIRTPMNAIMGMTQLAQDATDAAEQRGYLETVQTASVSLLALLNDILDLSKVEAGKLELAEDSFDVYQCVRDAVATLQLRASEKGLGLRIVIAAGVPRYVVGDELRVRQIVMNLLGNAIKFTDTGEVTVRLRAVPSAADGGVELRLTVTDTGIGVAADKQKVIFAPFEQADRSTTRKYGGTGLGLAISSQLVGLMHGAITIESPWLDDETGVRVQGTAFHFTARVGVGRAPARPAGERLTHGTRPLQVLVAEDNPVNQLLATRLLQKLGHTVTTASNGREAVERLDTLTPDVILMDVQMPEMDGFEATAAIRDREVGSGRRTPIIALTAHALQGYREECVRAGMDEYLTKPIRLEDLARMLATIAPNAAADAA